MAFIIFAPFIAGFSKMDPSALYKTTDDSLIQFRIDRTRAYFRDIGPLKLEQDVKLILPELERYFPIAVFGSSLNYPANHFPLILQHIWLYQPNNQWDRLSPELKDSTLTVLYRDYLDSVMDPLFIYSCLCNKITYPPDLLSRIDNNILKGGYELTHAALQYRNLHINQCITDAQYTAARSLIESELVEKILQAPAGEYFAYDLQIEAAVMLYYLRSPQVNDSEVKKIMHAFFDYQSGSGGWHKGPGKEISQHTSILALWWLLEMQAHRTTKN